MAAPTFQDLFDLAKAQAQSDRPELTFNDGDISEMLAAGAAAMGDSIVGWASGKFRSTFLDGAVGVDLTTLCNDHWDIQRKTAIAAYGTVLINRSTGPLNSGTIAAGTTVSTDADALGNKISYITSGSTSVIGNQTDVTLNVVCTVTGPTGNIIADMITTIVDPLFDTFTVVSSSIMAGGTDEETDSDLRNRVRVLRSVLARGTLNALEYGALQINGVSRATADSSTTGPNPTGIVTVYVSDLDGNSNATMTSAVTAELENWRAAGDVVNVVGGIQYIQTIEVALQVRAGTDVTSLITAIKTAIVYALQQLKLGDALYPSLVQTAVMNVDPQNILHCDVIQPATTLVPDPWIIFRTNTSSISVS